MDQQIIEEISTLRTKNDIKNIFWKQYVGSTASRTKTKQLNILILSAPCNGFGDIIFATKIQRYLTEWYHANVMIAAVEPEKFMMLGVHQSNMLRLGNWTFPSCRRFQSLDLENLDNTAIHTTYDLIFVAPLVADMDISMYDVKQLIPYATIFNTFFFSEYNDVRSKHFDFPTGVGKHNMGILMTDTPKLSKPSNMTNPYSVVYIAESIPVSKSCFLRFLEMIVVKYHTKHSKLDIVIPKWLVDVMLDYETQVVQLVSPYYPSISIKTKEETTTLSSSKSNNVLTFRADILPVKNLQMLKLIKYSVSDILLTGDQSITDAISCCGKSKNIFYQIAPWKEDFGEQLAKELPNKFFNSKKTSCGSLQAIGYTSDYSAFMKRWDFRKVAKPKMDAIIQAIIATKQSPKLQKIQQTILRSRTLRTLKSNIKNLP
jgi:hypothetical protein